MNVNIAAGVGTALAPLRVALFCGGRGSATLIRDLLRRPNVRLSLLVNAYDDGLSTGALRDFIPGMLGPSDFRKNLSYMLDLYSRDQYDLRRVIEYRLPGKLDADQLAGLKRFFGEGATDGLPESLEIYVKRLAPGPRTSILRFLRAFQDYAEAQTKPFDYRDCALGNLVFAGAYLLCGKDFNAAAHELSRLVSSRARLINVCKGENHVLVGLKADGVLLRNEAEIVDEQSDCPIDSIYFFDKPLSEQQCRELEGRTLAEKREWLATHETPASLSREAEEVLATADVIIYGPGTQHSSLLPSYRIAAKALKRSKASVKVFVSNLHFDNDIRYLSANDLVDCALRYVGDPENVSDVITHVLINDHAEGVKDAVVAARDAVGKDGTYKGARWIVSQLVNPAKPRVHSGRATIGKILDLYNSDGLPERQETMRLYVDLTNRPPALDEFMQEFLEVEWQENFSKIDLTIRGAETYTFELPPYLTVHAASSEERFAEVREIADWLENGSEDYLVTLTGDGEYRLNDILLGIQLIRNSAFGAVFGSRTQSRKQAKSSMRAAYGEHTVLYLFSLLSSFLLSFIFALRFGLILSDPLTGFRIYHRRRISGIARLRKGRAKSPISVVKELVRARIEIAEFPVTYITFAGFADSRQRLKRGFMNLYGLVSA